MFCPCSQWDRLWFSSDGGEVWLQLDRAATGRPMLCVHNWIVLWHLTFSFFHHSTESNCNPMKQFLYTAGRMYVCLSITKCHLEHREWLDLEVPILAHIHVDKVCLIFIQIVNFLDFHFQGKRFESSTLGSSYVIISQTVIDRANIAIALLPRSWSKPCVIPKSVEGYLETALYGRTSSPPPPPPKRDAAENPHICNSFLSFLVI